jgi:hypothetical protein
MFWRFLDSNTSNITYDQNFFSGGNYEPLDHQDVNGNVKIGMQKSRSNVIKFAFALGIDNPSATKTNGLCPKIFGPFSEPIYSVWKYDFNSGLYNDIVLVKENANRHKHVYKSSTI